MTRARDVANLIGSGNYSSTTFTATAGQTAFTIAHTQGFVQVFMNGLLLDETADYTSNGTAITLTSGAAAGDEIEVVKYNTFSVGDAIPASGGTFTGNVSMSSGSTLDTSAGTLVPSAGQVVQQVFTVSGATNTTTSTSFVATDTSVTITPLYSNSNMLIFFSGTAYSSSSNGWRGKIFKNGAEYSGDTSEDLQAYLNDTTPIGNVAARVEVDQNVNTTSPITYAYYFKNSTAGTAYWYRNTCMVVQEIKQ
jgi:hypothetical protein